MKPATYALLTRNADLLDKLGQHEAADEIRKHLQEPGSQAPPEVESAPVPVDTGTVHEVFAGDSGKGADK